MILGASMIQMHHLTQMNPPDLWTDPMIVTLRPTPACLPCNPGNDDTWDQQHCLRSGDVDYDPRGVPNRARWDQELEQLRWRSCAATGCYSSRLA